MPGARTQRFFDAAAGLGEHAVTRLWQDGASMTLAAAVRLALEDAGSAGPPSLVPQRSGEDAPAGGLTIREQEVVALLRVGLSNRDIAAKAVYQPGDGGPPRPQHSSPSSVSPRVARSPSGRTAATIGPSSSPGQLVTPG